jgi:hypothetical protein
VVPTAKSSGLSTAKAGEGSSNKAISVQRIINPPERL